MIIISNFAIHHFVSIALTILCVKIKLNYWYWSFSIIQSLCVLCVFSGSSLALSDGGISNMAQSLLQACREQSRLSNVKLHYQGYM